MPHKLLKYVDQQEAVFHHGRRDLQKNLTDDFKS
jgi:hypothetical protein